MTLLPPPTLASRLSPVDLAIVAAYLVAITLFGLRFARKGSKSTSLKTYFLADNAIPWWAIALSIVSAETSTLTIVSIPGVAFAGDLGFLQIVLGYMLGRIVVAFLFLPRYFRGEMLTAYQLIDQRFGPVLHKVTAGLFLLTRAAAEGVRVFAISIVVSIAIGTGDTLSIAIISALTLLYTFEGGMAAVIWTDVVQMALYVAGTVVALLTLGARIPGGWTHIFAVAQPLGKLHLLNFAFNLTQTYTFWAGVLGGTFLTMASHGTDQLMVQRMLAARNLRASQLALLSSGVVIFFQFTLFLLIGIGLFVFYTAHPQLFSTPDRIFPTFIVQQLPHGVAGLLVAAILAAAMSNLSAALNSLASTTVIDFYLPLRTSLHAGRKVILSAAPGAPSPDRESGRPATAAEPFSTTRISRLSTLFWALILFAIALYAIQHGGKGHVVETGLSIASVAYGSLLGVFLLGTLTRRANQWGAILGMICGFALNLYLWQGTFPARIGPLMIPHIAFTWYVLIGAAATFLLGLLFSALLPKPRTRPRTHARAATLLLCLFVTSTIAQQPVILSEARSAQPKDPHAPDPATSARPFPPQTSSSSSARPYDFTPISTLLNAAIADHKLPGAVVLIGHQGKVVFEQAYGSRKLAGEPGLDGKPSPAEPMTLDTIFDMASLTKVIVTTTAILQLYEQGKLSLDAPVAQYLPEFAQNGKDKITIRLLLTHYSGLPEDVSLKDDWGLRSPDKAEGIRRAMASVPYGPPAQTFKYSDINFITLGALVEKLSGETLKLYASEHILSPLGMSSSGFHAYDSICGPSLVVGAAIYPGPRPVGNIRIPCPRDTRSPNYLIPLTAPTAHDNEGTAATNPDFDHLLRGTVHDPTTRRMGGVAGHAGLFSTAGDMSLFCQALLDKLLHNTGPFPLKQSTLQLAISPQAPATAHADATIFTPDGEPTKGVAQRGLGWDLNSPFSRPRGSIFPTLPHQPASFGHTGFTGTSLWLDPTSDTYVILLANAIHPRGNPPISALRGQVATAAARALGLAPATLSSSTAGIEPAFQSTPHVILSEARSAQSKDPETARTPTTLRPTQPPTPNAPHPAPATLSSSTAGAEPASQSTPYVILSEARSAQSKDPETARTPSTLRPTQPPTPDAPATLSSSTADIEPAFQSTPHVILSEARSAQSKDPETARTPSTLRPTQPPNPVAPRRASQTWIASEAHPYLLRVSSQQTAKDLFKNQESCCGLSNDRDTPTQTGIDVLESTHFADLAPYQRIALLTNQSGIDSHQNRTIDLLNKTGKLTLIFTPEHGLSARQDTEHLNAEQDAATKLPIVSLYGPKASDKHPRQSDLHKVDAVFIDLPDAGVRFWTYETVTGYFLEDCARAHIPVYILDRPNPIGGGPAQGPSSDPGSESYIDFMPLPVRHGLTLGELARFFNAHALLSGAEPVTTDPAAIHVGPDSGADPSGETIRPPATQPGLHADLHIIAMRHWTRAEYFADTGLPWVPPSPNMKTPATGIVYPGVALIETTNMSVGRGSPAPYENFGAPFLDATRLATYLNARKLPGITFSASTLTIAETPEKYPFHGQTIPAIHLTVTHRDLLDSPAMGIELLAALHHLYPKEFELDKAKTILRNAQVLADLKAGKDPADIAASWAATVHAFNLAREPFLLYP